MSDTPETDACAKGIDQSNFEDSWKDDFEEFAWVPADFARMLERQREALLKKNFKLTDSRNYWKQSEKDQQKWHFKSAQALIECKRERDQLQNLCQNLAKELATVRTQNYELLSTTERVLNATVLNHRNERWHADAEYTVEKAKLNQNL